MNNQTGNFKFFLAIIAVVFVTACNNNKKIPPFPVMENEYAQPVVKDFSFPQADTIHWESQELPALKSLPTTKFDWNKLPEKPFDIGLPYPLKKPMTSKPFDWNALKGVPFNLDSLPQAELKVKVAVLGQPNIVKAGIPTNAAGASRGVMTLASGFGLPATAYSQLLDSDGMMWFGINNGVVKYDSDNLEIYGLDQGLEGKYANSFLEDSKGRIWIVGNQGSISVMDRKLNLTYELTSSFNLSRLFEIKEDKNGLFWIATGGNGYHIINFEEKTMYQFDTKNGLLANGGLSIFEDKKGFLWISTFQGVHIIDPSRTKNYTLTTANGLESSNAPAPTIIEDKQGRVWLTGLGGIHMLNKDKTSLSFISAENFDHEGQMISDIFQDHAGKFWVATSNGLVFSYAEETGLLQKFILRPTTANDQFIHTILENDQREIWAVSRQGGIYKIDANGFRPGNYRTESGLGDNNVWATLEAKDGKIWIGTHNGIDVYDPVKKSLKHLGVEQGLAHPRNTSLMQDSKGNIWAGGNIFGNSIIDPEKQTIQKLTTDAGIKSHSLRSTLEDMDRSVWLISSTGEIQNIDLENSRYKTFIDRDSLVHVSRKDAVVQTDKNTIWVADGAYGLHKIDLAKNIKWRFTTDNGLISNDLFSVAKDAENNIWIATDKGVQMLDEKNQTITTFTVFEGLGANDVYDIKQKEGKIYLGTSKGLTILQPLKEQNQTFWKTKTIAKNQGLDFLDFTQNSISFDKNGFLWAGVEGQMLTVMNEPALDTTAYPTAISSLNIFDKKLTFQNKEDNQKEYARDSITGQNKNDFALKNTIDSSYQNLHHIAWEKVKGPYDLPVALTLPYDQNYLSFNYNGRQFNNPDKVVYRYILEGIDKQWSPITSNTTSENYRDLPPGNYTFKVASKGFNGIWSKPAEFSFSITPPWWQTWWAYLIFASLFLGLGLVILNYRSRWLKKENKLLEEKVAIRTAELKNKMEELQAAQSQLIQAEKMASLGELTAGIAHEIQNPMNFINNFSEVSSELMAEMCHELEKGDLEEAKVISKDILQNLEKIGHHGKRASSIVKGMLEHSRNSSGKKELVDINVLTDEYLRLAYHGLRAKDKSFNAGFTTDFDPGLSKINIIPQDISRVVLNLINNAFYTVNEKKKKGETNYKPMVTVSTKKVGDGVQISVKDNGSGIPEHIKEKIFQPFFTTKPAGQGTGLGLSLSYDIVKAHGGELKVETKESEGFSAGAAGTEFIILLP